MLALIFRGVFIAGVVGWYSTSMWLMIDGYFKDQFQRYLEEEYHRNPKMCQDVRVNAVEKTGQHLADASKQVVAELLESCDLSEDGSDSECTVGAAGIGEVSRREDESVPLESIDAFGTGATEELAEKQVVGPIQRAKDEPPPAFENTDAERRKNVLDVEIYNEQDLSILDELQEQFQNEQRKLEKPQSQKQEHETQQQNFQASEEQHLLEQTQQQEQHQLQHEHYPLQEQQRKSLKQEDQEPEQDQQQKHQNLQQHDRKLKTKQMPIRKKRKKSARPEIGAKPEDAVRRKQKREKFPTLTLTDVDFDSAAKRKQRFRSEDDDWDGEEAEEEDRDFAEFDDKANRRKKEDEKAGMPVADLPFRPAIDIYDLERVSGEEFCPLTLEDDPSCEEIREWP